MDFITMALSQALSKKYTDEQIANLGIDDVSYYFCSSTEYNSTTGVPIITSPDGNTFYAVPSITGGNGFFNVYIYKNNDWELFTSIDMDETNIPIDNSLTISGMAADAKQVGDKITDLKADYSELSETGSNTETKSLLMTFQSGRVTVSNSTVTVATNSKFAYVLYPKLKAGIEYTMHVPNGLKVYGYVINKNDGTYSRLENFTSAWVTGEATVTHVPTMFMPNYYLVLTIQKTNGTNITVEEAAEITITYSESIVIKSIANSNIYPSPTGGQILYEGDTKSESGFIVNAVAYKDGVIIACRSNGDVVRIGYGESEEVLLSLTGTNFDWRCCYIASNERVFVSPHASVGEMEMSDRGLYMLEKGGSSLTKVLNFYNASEPNDDTIWTMCEDSNGVLYAGRYSHTIIFKPVLYKSVDGGSTWTVATNFIEYGVADAHHIHSIIYSKWTDSLYCILGEINTIWKSTDGAVSWKNLDITLNVKGSAMLATPEGILVGSDGAYNCQIDMVFYDDITHETVYDGWANTVFGIRVSDVTGFIYAFTKIDSSVGSEQYYPPYGVLYGTKTIEEWKAGDYTSGNTPAHLEEWEDYNEAMSTIYPDDAIRPQHFAILVSRDGGKSFEVLKAFSCDSRTAYGIWCIGYFINGECICGIYTGDYVDGSYVSGIMNPIVISEGKHKYVADGCDLEGEIFVKTNTSDIVQLV